MNFIFDLVVYLKIMMYNVLFKVMECLFLVYKAGSYIVQNMVLQNVYQGLASKQEIDPVEVEIVSVYKIALRIKASQ